MQRYYPIIDNGHGALTKGKRSPKLPDGRQFFEWKFNWEVAKALEHMLWEEGVKCGMVNIHPQDKGNDLAWRVGLANDLATEARKKGMEPYFISIHSNAAPDSHNWHFSPGDGWQDYAEGVETWYYRKSWKGRRIALVFQRHIVTETNMKDRGLRYHPAGPSFYVLRKTNMPAILTENGFFNHYQEVDFLLTDKAVRLVAQGHFCAIMEIETNGI